VSHICSILTIQSGACELSLPRVLSRFFYFSPGLHPRPNIFFIPTSIGIPLACSIDLLPNSSLKRAYLSMSWQAAACREVSGDGELAGGRGRPDSGRLRHDACSSRAAEAAENSGRHHVGQDELRRYENQGVGEVNGGDLQEDGW
jgi:hypothetical protein